MSGSKYHSISLHALEELRGYILAMHHRSRSKSGNRLLQQERILLPDGRSALKIEPSSLFPSDDTRMTAHTDWLADLRESKQQAIARARDKGAGQQALWQTAEERLRFRQTTLAALIGQTQLETLLQEFCVEILRDHPNFLGYSLRRTVRSRSAASAVERTEPDPWSGPVENNPLPQDLDLGNGRHVTAVDWKLRSDYNSMDWHELRPLTIHVSATTAGVKLDGQLLSPPTVETLKRALLDAFKATLHTLGRRRGHRHRRSWYRRLWRTLFPRSKVSITQVAGSIIVITLSVVFATHVVQNISLKP
jgi:hypothetical protein